MSELMKSRLDISGEIMTVRHRCSKEIYILDEHMRSWVSKVWQVWHVPWTPFEGGATDYCFSVDIMVQVSER